MKNDKKYEIDMSKGSIFTKMFVFALPLICSSILQLLFNAADIVVVGRFAGDNSLAAVGSTTSLIQLLVNLFIGLSVGSNVLVARYYGAKQYKQLSNTVHTTILLSILSGLFISVVGIIFAKPILVLMQTPDEVLPLAVTYIRIYFGGMIATMLYNFGSAILRAVGDTKRPLYYLSLAGVINVILNLIFVIVFRMDVAGVAIATVISQCVSALLVLRCLFKENSAIRVEFSKLKMDKESILKILQIGLPAGFQGMLFSLSNMVIQSSVNGFGAVVVAGNSAANNIEGFVYVAMNAFYQATISFTGQNLGAGNFERIRKTVLIGLLYVLAVGAILGNCAYYFGNTLIGIYSINPLVIEAGIQRLKYTTRLHAICGMMDVMVGAMRGLGHSLAPMIITLIGACGLRLAWIAIMFSNEAYHTIDTVYVSYPISWSVTLIANVICFLIMFAKTKKRMTENEYAL